MIYLLTTSTVEAKPFIDRFDLKKETSQDFLEVYSNRYIMLLVTCPTPVVAAIMTSSFFSQRRPSTRDIVVHVGLCAGIKENIQVGDMFLVYKIEEQYTQKKFFPDLLFTHPFREASVTTLGCSYKKGEESGGEKIQTEIADTESAAIFQTTMAVLHTHYVYFFKIVSGKGERGKIAPAVASRLIGDHMDEIMEWILEIEPKVPKEYEFDFDLIASIKRISKYLLLSPTKEQELFQYVFFYMTESGRNSSMRDVRKLLKEFYSEIEKKEILLPEEGFAHFSRLRKLISI